MATTIVVSVPGALADTVVDRMWQWGVHAVSEVEVGDGWTEVTTSVGDDGESIDRALSTLDPTWRCEVREVDDSIAQVAPEHLSPSWYADDMVSVPASLLPFDAGGAFVTVIDPGSAFGLGDHPSTRTAMALLAGMLRTDRLEPRSLLDVGCGAGALAVLAAQLGVPTVRAIDIADAAVEATRRNVVLNGVDGVVADTTPVSDVRGPYDIVVANILAPVLISMADDLRRLVAPNGSLLISGILADRHDHVLAALEPLRPIASLVHDGWISIVLG